MKHLLEGRKRMKRPIVDQDLNGLEDMVCDRGGQS